jgi:hypothetical protein
MSSEREKMLRGEPYLASDPELVAARIRARRLWQRYNASHPGEHEARTALLTERFIRVGVDVIVEPPFYCDYGSQIERDDGVFVNFNCVFLDSHVYTSVRRHCSPQRPVADGRSSDRSGCALPRPGIRAPNRDRCACLDRRRRHRLPRCRYR